MAAGVVALVVWVRVNLSGIIRKGRGKLRKVMKYFHANLFDCLVRELNYIWLLHQAFGMECPTRATTLFPFGGN